MSGAQKSRLRRPKRLRLRSTITELMCSARLTEEMLHRHSKDLKVQHRVCCSRLDRRSIDDEAVESLQLESIGVLVRFDDFALSVRAIVILGDVHGDWQTFHIRCVILQADSLVRRVKLKMGVKPRDIINAALV